MKDEPEIISSGLPHEVHLPEGSRTAVSKTASAMEPQIRKTAANHDDTVEVIEVVKGVTHQQVEEERLAQLAQAGSKVEKARAAQVAEGTATSERMAHAEGTESKDRFAQAPEGHEEAARMANAEGAAEEDRMAQAEEPAEQPEHLVSEDSTASAPSTHNTALPLGQLMADLPSLDLPASEAALPVAPEPLPASPDVPPEPAPPAQEAAAPADTSNAAGEMATAQQQMAEMNFPARVVKLKIANDQMRGQIEKLEKPLFAPIPVEAPAPEKAKGKEKEAAKKPAKGH